MLIGLGVVYPNDLVPPLHPKDERRQVPPLLLPGHELPAPWGYLPPT